jgi:hypothetical protein
MGKEFKPLSWLVTYYDCNVDQIKYYDILKYRQDFIKKLKKKCANKEEFAKKLDSELRWSYWSKCEWELIVEVDENSRVWLSPWVGSRDPQKVKIDVTDREDFDWRGFAEVHIGRQIYKNRAKVDVYDQLTFADQFEKLIDCCWYTHLPYERDSEKFHRQTEENV